MKEDMKDETKLQSKLKTIKTEVLLAYWTYFSDLPSHIDLGKIHRLFAMVDEMTVEDGIATAQKIKSWICALGIGVTLEETQFEEILASSHDQGVIVAKPLIPARIASSQEAALEKGI
jgi:hypothetical protein